MKSRQSSISNPSQNLVDLATELDQKLQHQPAEANECKPSDHKLDVLAKEASLQAKPMKAFLKESEERAVSVSPIGQEESLKVEDVFNDQ